MGTHWEFLAFFLFSDNYFKASFISKGGDDRLEMLEEVSDSMLSSPSATSLVETDFRPHFLGESGSLNI